MRQLIQQAETKQEKIDFIFMVGGFSESPFLKNEIIHKFESENIQVLLQFSGSLTSSLVDTCSQKTSGVSYTRSLHVWSESKVNPVSCS